MRFTLLRAFVVAAVLANLGYAAWQGGLLAGAGLQPSSQRDPARLQQQVRPQALRVLSPAATASAVAAAASAAAVGPLPTRGSEPTAEAASAPPVAASAPTGAASSDAANALACLDIGPFDNAAAADGAERALAALLPVRAWVREQRPAVAQYAVFVGPVLSREAARQRREELVKLKISFEAIELPDGRGGERQGGYSLGRHDSEAAALAALEAFRERGLKGGRVVLAREAGPARPWLHVERLTQVQADAVRSLPATTLAGARPAECSLGSVMSVGAPR